MKPVRFNVELLPAADVAEVVRCEKCIGKHDWQKN